MCRSPGYDRIALAQFASAFYDHPSRKLIVIGITGTDGKTTNDQPGLSDPEDGRPNGRDDLHGQRGDR